MRSVLRLVLSLLLVACSRPGTEHDAASGADALPTRELRFTRVAPPAGLDLEDARAWTEAAYDVGADLPGTLEVEVVVTAGGVIAQARTRLTPGAPGRLRFAFELDGTSGRWTLDVPGEPRRSGELAAAQVPPAGFERGFGAHGAPGVAETLLPDAMLTLAHWDWKKPMGAEGEDVGWALRVRFTPD